MGGRRFCLFVFVCLFTNYCYKIGFSIVNNSKKNEKMLRKEKEKKKKSADFFLV